ncbi:unnamed protein product [Taenia asiatica]|uniref:F-box domain-containing protein n=1 Tax=Taenia asiatica TaxID=60517 RepID=A0A158RAJ2_TAEAS|nr:unnamed protein product [Taenia asiatica]
MGELFFAFISDSESVFMVLVDGSKFPTISSPFAVIPASPSGLPVSDVTDQRSFDFASTRPEKVCLPNYCDESYSSNTNKNEEGKSFSAAVTPAQLSGEMGEGKGRDHAFGVDSTSATPATSSPSTMRLSSSCPLTEKMSWAISDRSLQVDCQMEFFPRYVQKPPAMYTFLCAQDIPRRAYARHTLLHSEAVVQVDYWLEQRCPLAYLGCPFSVVRLRPNSPAAHLAYMPTVNAFTVRYTSANTSDSSTAISITSAVTSTCSPDATSSTSAVISANSAIASGAPSATAVASVCRLERLPLQVLKRIINMLDEVSLMSLSRVSPQLAEVCRRSLPSRGIVTPVWQREPRTGWRISGFVWSLPTCGEPVRCWRITDSPAPLGTQITRHLHSECAFYEALRAQQPFCLYNPSEKPPFLSGVERKPDFI